jgi:predicted Fe-Mo cluster-binding NifX family protein
MISKTLIPLYQNEVAPRFDLATEARIITVSKNNVIEEERSVVLAQASAEKLCHLIQIENIKTVICGAIEDEYYQFLKWKKVTVYDSVAGLCATAFEAFLNNKLKSGAIFFKRSIEGNHV